MDFGVCPAARTNATLYSRLVLYGGFPDSISAFFFTMGLPRFFAMG